MKFSLVVSTATLCLLIAKALAAPAPDSIAAEEQKGKSPKKDLTNADTLPSSAESGTDDTIKVNVIEDSSEEKAGDSKDELNEDNEEKSEPDALISKTDSDIDQSEITVLKTEEKNLALVVETSAKPENINTELTAGSKGGMSEDESKQNILAEMTTQTNEKGDAPKDETGSVEPKSGSKGDNDGAPKEGELKNSETSEEKETSKDQIDSKDTGVSDLETENKDGNDGQPENDEPKGNVQIEVTTETSVEKETPKDQIDSKDTGVSEPKTGGKDGNGSLPRDDEPKENMQVEGTTETSEEEQTPKGQIDSKDTGVSEPKTASNGGMTEDNEPKENVQIEETPETSEEKETPKDQIDGKEVVVSEPTMGTKDDDGKSDEDDSQQPKQGEVSSETDHIEPSDGGDEGNGGNDFTTNYQDLITTGEDVNDMEVFENDEVHALNNKQYDENLFEGEEEEEGRSNFGAEFGEETEVGNNNEKDGYDYIDEYGIEEEKKGHFFAFILFAMFLTAVLYILYHNKRKVLAWVLPGTQRRTGMRHRGGYKANYERLENKPEGKTYVF